MSFTCDKCHQAQVPHTKPIRVVVETRRRSYPRRYAKDGKKIIDEGGHGSEIVREMNLCPLCFYRGELVDGKFTAKS